jgi:hypothetical protein
LLILSTLLTLSVGLLYETRRRIGGVAGDGDDRGRPL